jgi:hypothetical protein
MSAGLRSSILNRHGLRDGEAGMMRLARRDGLHRRRSVSRLALARIGPDPRPSTLGSTEGQAEQYGADHESCADQYESQAMPFWRVLDLRFQYLAGDRHVLVFVRGLTADDALHNEHKPEYEHAEE